MTDILGLQRMGIDEFGGERVAQFSCSSCIAFTCGGPVKTTT